MAELTERAGLPLPEIRDAGGCVMVVFRPVRYVAPQQVVHGLTERQQRLLTLLAGHQAGLPLREIKVQIGPLVAEWEVKADLAVLKRLGLAKTTGRGRGAYWFWLVRSEGSPS
jgi:hypothetical protein